MADPLTEADFSVVYRTGPLTPADYDEAIEALTNARDQIAARCAMGCAVCGDSGHAAGDECHHDPLVLARKWAAATSIWNCWHCGFTATTADEAREHFGLTERDDPKCITDLTAQRDRAMIRIGSLGLSPQLDQDAQEVVAALGSMTDHRGDGIPTQFRNPDGKAAVALIEATIAERDQLRRLLGDALADLEKSDRRSSKVAGLIRAELAKAPDAV